MKPRKVVIIGDCAYQMTKTQAKSMVEFAREQLRGKCAIVALERGGVYILCRKVYRSRWDLNAAMIRYSQQGYRTFGANR